MLLIWLAPAQRRVHASCSAWGENVWQGINDQVKYDELEANLVCQLGQHQCEALCNEECEFYNGDDGEQEVDCHVTAHDEGCGANAPCWWEVSSNCSCGSDLMLLR
jgi:hypothetical protein